MGRVPVTLDLPALIERGGALAIFLGAGLEGEAAVVTGGWLAGRGIVHPLTAALCAFAGSFTADQIIFTIGRRNRGGRRTARLLATRAARRAIHLVERHPVLFCLVFRFAYGFRIAGPLAVGVSTVPALRFVALNAVAAAVWASTFTYLGYRYGQRVEQFVVRLATEHGWLLVAVVAIVVAAVAWLLLRREADA